MKAKIYAIGVGPGAPDLIPIKAKQALAKELFPKYGNLRAWGSYLALRIAFITICRPPL